MSLLNIIFFTANSRTSIAQLLLWNLMKHPLSWNSYFSSVIYWRIFGINNQPSVVIDDCHYRLLKHTSDEVGFSLSQKCVLLFILYKSLCRSCATETPTKDESSGWERGVNENQFSEFTADVSSSITHLYIIGHPLESMILLWSSCCPVAQTKVEG